MTVPTIPTEADLIRLLEAKDAAEAIYTAAYRLASGNAGKPADAGEQVTRDIAHRVAWRRFQKAEQAYDEALTAYAAAQAERAA